MKTKTSNRDFDYRPITWWSNAAHVYENDIRLGIVVKQGAFDKTANEEFAYFEAFNANFLQIEGAFPSLEVAANAIPPKGGKTSAHSIAHGKHRAYKENWTAPVAKP